MKKILIAILLIAISVGATLPAEAGSVVGGANTGNILGSPATSLVTSAVCSNPTVASDALGGLATILGTQVCI